MLRKLGLLSLVLAAFVVGAVVVSIPTDYVLGKMESSDSDLSILGWMCLGGAVFVVYVAGLLKVVDYVSKTWNRPRSSGGNRIAGMLMWLAVVLILSAHAAASYTAAVWRRMMGSIRPDLPLMREHVLPLVVLAGALAEWVFWVANITNPDAPLLLIHLMFASCVGACVAAFFTERRKFTQPWTIAA